MGVRVEVGSGVFVGVVLIFERFFLILIKSFELFLRGESR